MSITNDIKYRFKNAGIVEKFIYINIGVFILTLLLNTFHTLFKGDTNFITNWFSLSSNFSTFITKPWTIVTYGFLHSDFLHIFFNLIALFFIGNLFIEYFTPKQFINFYVLGTIFGGVLYLIGYQYIPILQGKKAFLVGASAGVTAILVGIATYIPNYQLKFRFIGFIKLWHIAAFWVLLDVLRLSGSNTGGYLSHLGGAIFGFLYVKYASNKKIEAFSSLKNLFKRKQKPLKTVYKSGKVSNKQTKSENQQQVDAILDKISKSGYDALSKEEKDFLFKQGR